MSWVIYALLAAFLYSLVSIMDKFIITKWIKNPFVPPIAFGIAGLLASAAVYFFHGFSSLSIFNIGLAVLSGFFSIAASVVYFKALKIEEVSRVAPMLYLDNLFVIALAAIFLGEFFTFQKYTGALLLIFGAVLIASKKFDFKPGKALKFVLAAGFIWASSAVAVKYLLSFADFWTIFSYTRIGAFVAVIPISYFYLNEFLATIKKHGKKVVLVMSANELFAVSGIFISTFALTLGPVALVQTLISIQPLFVFVLSLLLTVFFPKIIKEEIDRKTLLLKAVAIAAVIIGAVLVT